MLERRLCPRSGPFHIPFGGRIREDKPPRCIRPVFGDDIDRVDNVAFGFRHFGGWDDLYRLARGFHGLGLQIHLFGHVIDRAAIFIAGLVDRVGHHALGEEGIERLGRGFGQMAGDVHRPRKEARIEQVENRVFDPTDILIDIHPIGGVFQIRGGLSVRSGEARIIPRAVHEGVHRVGFTTRRLTASRAGAIAPCRVPVQRIAGDREINRLISVVIGQRDGQVFFLLGHHTAIVAIDNGDRATPITLARQAPITQAELGHTRAKPFAFHIADGGIDCLLPRRDVEPGEMVDPFHLFGFWRDKGRAINGCVILY